MDFLKILTEAHSGIRWIVLLAIVLILARLLILVGSKGRAKPIDHTLSKWGIISIDIQFLIGLSLALSYAMNSTLQNYQIEHLATAFIGVALAHVGAGRLKRNPVKNGAALFLFALATLFFVVAVVRLPQGFFG